MASPPEQPWSNHERNYLLAEIIKAHNPHHEVLLNVIRSLRIEPRWEETPLPNGRSLNSSRFAYDSMQRSQPAQPMSVSTIAPQTPMTIPVSTLKRPFVPSEGPYSASGREIRPKPLMGAAQGYSQPSPSEPPPKRKRGRPTKAEQQAKADAAAAAAAMSFEARSIPSRQSLMPTSTPAPGPSPVEEIKPMLPPTTRMPIAAMLTPTTREDKSASNSSSSSGKRRRGRSTKTEPEDTPTARASSDYNSPHDLRAPDDSPARTAVLRHREEMGHPPRYSHDSGQQQQQPQQQQQHHPQQQQPYHHQPRQLE